MGWLCKTVPGTASTGEIAGSSEQSAAAEADGKTLDA
jgi:hypothetical protein